MPVPMDHKMSRASSRSLRAEKAAVIELPTAMTYEMCPEWSAWTSAGSRDGIRKSVQLKREEASVSSTIDTVLQSTNTNAIVVLSGRACVMRLKGLAVSPLARPGSPR